MPSPRRRLLRATGLPVPEVTVVDLRGVAGYWNLPVLAGLAQGPGFPNLSCLGLLADRVPRPSVTRESQPRAAPAAIAAESPASQGGGT